MTGEELKTRFDTLQEVYQLIENTIEEEELEEISSIHDVLVNITEKIRDCVDEYHNLTGIALT